MNRKRKSPGSARPGQFEVAAPGLRKSELKRQRILDAAARLFCDRGFAEIRMSDIAAEAGTQSGAMYYYFDSKDALVEEFLRNSLQPHTDFMRAAVEGLPPGSSWRLRIETAIRAHLERALERDNYTMGFMKIFDQVPPAVRERFAAYPRDYAQLWRGLVNGAIAAGELRNDIDPVVMRNALMGSLDWTLEWYQPGRLSPAELAVQMTRLFMDGMGALPAAGKPSRARQSLLATLQGCSEETILALEAAASELLRAPRPRMTSGRGKRSSGT